MMPSSVASWLLFHLHTMRTDPISAAHFAGGHMDGYPDESNLKRQLAVDTIYRCLRCDLVEIDPAEWRQVYGLKDIEEFARQLAHVDPFRRVLPSDTGYEQHANEMMIWLAPELYNTRNGDALIDRHSPAGLDLDDEERIAAFNVEICEIFESNGVPWGSRPLVLS